MSFLIKVQYKGKSASFQTRGQKLYIGRSNECHVRLKDPLISSKHCILFIDNNHLSIKDLISTNGTFVNGLQITDEKLYIGDIIIIGHTKLIFTSKMMTKIELKKHTRPSETYKTTLIGINLPKEKNDASDPSVQKVTKRIVKLKLPDE